MLQIVFENDFFVVVDKPSGYLSVPSRQGEDDKRFCVGILLQDQIAKRLYPVHRLDFEVSGLLLFALTPEAHKVACRWFEQGEVRKRYSALSEGEVPQFKTEVWHSKLLRGKKRAYEAPHGKESITNVFFISQEPAGVLRFELEPVTGRSHQLRYELSRHSYPILGDALYGSTQSFQAGIALRSFLLDFSKCKERKSFGLPEFIETSKL